uniref:Uncharacterized protein n=1 Tax=Cacopsylla melanoneura TaxID=428564 RepID=A0A8D9EH82_9HEMI
MLVSEDLLLLEDGFEPESGFIGLSGGPMGLSSLFLFLFFSSLAFSSSDFDFIFLSFLSCSVSVRGLPSVSADAMGIISIPGRRSKFTPEILKEPEGDGRGEI